MPSRKDDEAAGELHGSVYSVAGPVVVAENLLGCSMFELVRVGRDRLVGEIIRIDADKATIQVYEDTSGLSVGEPVRSTGMPMTAELGPGLLQTLFDGVQRDLAEVSRTTGSIYIPRGIDIPAINREKKWDFVPGDFKVGDHITGGDAFGTVFENSLLPDHKILLPPRKMGTITRIAEAGSYTVDETILEVEFEGKPSKYSMLQKWPIRVPRPVNERITSNQPLIIGQRVLDALFPVAQGGTVCIPGAFGCGKTVISHSLAKYSNSDIIVYVGCGERGNELAEVLQEFPELHVEIDGRQEPIMKRTVLIGNTSNMPVAARESSIYQGITIAEYFRDQGKHVSLVADSTSRWAEALREISGRLEEMPGESGFPSYLGTKLAAFYERAGLATARGLPVRKGSVSIIGAVSPAGGDFSEPVTQSTLKIVQAFWGLDRALAQRKHFPSINVHDSWTKYTKPLQEYYNEHHPDLGPLRDTIKLLLANFREVMQTIQLIGTESLTGQDRVVYYMGKLVEDEFLQQNAFSPNDQFCPLWKTVWMMRVMVKYHDELQAAVLRGENAARVIGATRDIRTKIVTMKFELPSDGEDVVSAKYEKIMEDMSSMFASLDIE